MNVEVFPSDVVRVRGVGGRVEKLYVPPKPSALKFLSDSSPQLYWRERQGLELLGGEGAAEVLDTCPHGLITIMSRLKGDNAGLLMENGLPQCKKEEIYLRVGEKLRLIHDRRLGGRSPKNYFEELKRKAIEDADGLGRGGLLKMAGIEENVLNSILIKKVIPRAEEVSRSYRELRLVWGDACSRNVVAYVNGGVSVAGFTGLEFWHPGFREEDLAYLVMWDWGKKEWGKEPFQRGYGEKLDEERIKPFIMLKLLDGLKPGRVEDWRKEMANGEKDGFLSSNLRLLQREWREWLMA